MLRTECTLEWDIEGFFFFFWRWGWLMYDSVLGSRARLYMVYC